MAARGSTKKAGSKRGSSHKGGVDQRLVKALSHTLREQILIILNERIASPNELAKELEEGLSQVSYHVKVLKDYRCIELVKTEPRRGAVEHYYRATSRAFLSDRDWKSLPDSIRAGLSGGLVQTIVHDAVDALDTGTFDEREDRHLTRVPLTVDEQGWNEITSILEETLHRVLKVQVESSERIGESDGDGIPAVVAMMGFEVPASHRSPGAPAKGRASKKAKA